MRAIGSAAVLGLLMSVGVAMAQERDAPPPGCRWLGDDLGCKDGRGNYRRAGDGEVIGRYPVAKPKPKPTPRPAAEAAPTELPPSPNDVAVANAAMSAADDAAVGLNGAPAANADAAPVLAETPAPPLEAASPPAPAKPKPWWRAVWDWLVNDLMNLLRRLGLAK